MICVDDFSNSHINIPHSDRITDNHPNNFVFVVSYWWDVAARHNHHPILWILKAILKHPHFCHCNLSRQQKCQCCIWRLTTAKKKKHASTLQPEKKKRDASRRVLKKKYLFLPQQAAFFFVDDWLFCWHLEREQRSWKTIQPSLEATPHRPLDNRKLGSWVRCCFNDHEIQVGCSCCWGMKLRWDSCSWHMWQQPMHCEVLLGVFKNYLFQCMRSTVVVFTYDQAFKIRKGCSASRNLPSFPV